MRLAERTVVELLVGCLVEVLVDTVQLRMMGLGPRMADILHDEVRLVGVILKDAAGL
jgi:hypothetical protein